MSVLEDCFNFLGLLPLKAVEMESILQLKYNAAPQRDAAKTFSVPVVKSIQRAMSPWNSALKLFLGSPLPDSWHYPMDALPAYNPHQPPQNEVAVVAKQNNLSFIANELNSHGPSREKEVANKSKKVGMANQRRQKIKGISE